MNIAAVTWQICFMDEIAMGDSRDISWSGVVLSCLPCVVTDSPNMIIRLPVFGTKHMKAT